MHRCANFPTILSESQIAVLSRGCAPPILGKGRLYGVVFERAFVSSYNPPCVLFLYQQSFALNFTLQFSMGVANPRFWGRGGRMRSGMVPFERALVSFYRPSIITFPKIQYSFNAS